MKEFEHSSWKPFGTQEIGFAIAWFTLDMGKMLKVLVCLFVLFFKHALSFIYE